MSVHVLVVSPHPDDEAIGCGGTLRKHVAEGDVVEVVFLTSGEAGSHDRRPAPETARLREAEAHEAAGILGLERIDFWRLPDGRLRITPPVVERLTTAIRERRPDVLYVPHEAESHRDHAAAARLVRKALARLGNYRPEAFGFELWTPLRRMTRVVDITAHIEIKMAAIRAYRSQCEFVRFDEAFLGLARYRGEMFSWPKHEGMDGVYAEVFATIAP